MFLKEARPKRLIKPNPRYIDSSDSSSKKNGKRLKPDDIVSASSKGVQKKQIIKSKEVQRPDPKSLPNQSAFEVDKPTEKQQLKTKEDKKKKDKKKKAVKFHFTIDCSNIDQMDLLGLVSIYLVARINRL